MPDSKTIQKLTICRDQVDARFLEFVVPGKIEGNFEALAHLALIGGRLDTLIRRTRAAERGKLG